MNIEDLRPISLFEGLSESQLGDLIRVGLAVPVEVGVELFHEGNHADHWWLLVNGAITLTRRVGDGDVEVGSMNKPGLWSGGFRAWNDQGVYLATGIGALPGEVLRVPAIDLRNLLNGWFPFGTHLVAGLHGTAHTIEANARQRESLITLGTLSAGLAHELNNPATAAVRAADGIEATSDALLGTLAQLAGTGITAGQFQSLDSLRSEVTVPTRPDADPIALADCEERLTRWLTSHGVGRPWTIAPQLAAAEVDLPWCERVLTAVGPDALESAVSWVASTFEMRDLLAEVKESTRRISRLVGAMRSHSQMDRAARQSTDVTEGLESTLLILAHKLRDGITVVRDFAADLPRIDGYPGELNQVWTNLVDNAIDAMDRGGTLRLTTRSEADSVVVEVIDSGPGMSTQVQHRAFEAFYTTKEVGKGTGLGLDIARRIVVDRHHGSIDIESEAGRTVLRVRLPR